MVQPPEQHGLCLHSQFHLLWNCLFPHLSRSFGSKGMKSIPLTGKSLFSSHRQSGGYPRGSASSKSCSQNSKYFLLTVNPQKSIPPPFRVPRLSQHQERVRFRITSPSWVELSRSLGYAAHPSFLKQSNFHPSSGRHSCFHHF